MSSASRRLIRAAALVLLAAVMPVVAPTSALAAPILGEVWSSDVLATSAKLSARVTPNGASTSYHFDYIKTASYEANLGAGKEGFSGAARAPSGADVPLGAGASALTALQTLSGLSAETAYRYRVVLKSGAETVTGATLKLVTRGFGGGSVLLDGRGWEMVSPVDKNGGAVAAPGALAGGGTLQAGGQGGVVTFGSAASFGSGAQGAPQGSQYVSRRGASGWSTENITPPLLSGSYGTGNVGVPYQLFSTDLARGLLLDPRRCAEGEPCPRSYSLREAGATTATSTQQPDLRFAAASADLRHVVLSTCAALTSDATEVPLGGGCDPAEPNLYDWSGGTLRLLNVLPGDSQGTPAAALAGAPGSVSGDASHVYFTQGGDLYLREATGTKWVDEAVGGGGELLAATPDGGLAFYVKAGLLYRYGAVSGTSTEIDPGGTVGAPLQVSADGTKLAFGSTSPLTGYDNTDQGTGEPDSQVYLYDVSSDALACISCNPTEARPIGSSSIPGARPNGTVPGSFAGYQPRALSDDGRRLFFDSADALALGDTNNAPDAYEWEAQGMGGCTRPGGCLALVSSGKGEEGASFADASADGADAYFLTARSLVGSDPGSVDLYDARVGGGFPEPPTPIPCEGDACQVIPSEPTDPPLNTLVTGPGNAKVRYVKLKRTHHKQHRKHGRKHHEPHRGGKHGSGRRR